jgi:hypothetical protein
MGRAGQEDFGMPLRWKGGVSLQHNAIICEEEHRNEVILGIEGCTTPVEILYSVIFPKTT